MKIIVKTAEKLDTSQLKNIRSAFAKKYPETKIQELVDESLVGGIQIMIDSQLYDGSVKAKLEQIKTKAYKLI